MNKQIERQINEIYNKVYKEVFNKTNTASLAKGSRVTIQIAMTKLQSSNKYNEFAKKFAIELAKRGLNNKRGVWRKYYQAAKSARYVALPPTYKDYEYSLMTKAVQHNFNMIKSIPTRMLEILNHKYTSTLIEEVAKGTQSRGSFQRLLAKHGHNQAKLIARTETAKLQTAITKARATELGSIAYTWISSNDKRTRPSHKAMNNVIVFWQDDLHKPLLDNMRGDAGEFPNCRCDPQPIVDTDDIKAARYKVYNYHNDTVIWMSKYDLIEALKIGKLPNK